MKAIITGTISDGFTITDVVANNEAKGIVLAHLAKGVLAEELDVLAPSTKDSDFDDSTEGSIYVMLSECGVLMGVEVYGPFSEMMEAEDFGEGNRPVDGEYATVNLKMAKTQEEYAFDVKLMATIRIKAQSQSEAEATIRETLDAASCNAGAWPDGSPVLFEASTDGCLDLVEVDGKPV